MRRSSQLTFEDLRARSKKRTKKPGPKATHDPSVRHRVRPVHKWWHPMHITLRAIDGLASFRQQLLLGAFHAAVARTRQPGFRIVEFSIQTNHVHLLVEADDNDALTRGMRSFTVRANRLFNSASRRRRGKVWAHRYHRTDLTSPRQVRSALVYCLNNRKKHAPAERMTKPDPCSSGPWFDGWTNATASTIARAGPRLTALPETFLLRTAWHRHGFIHPGESPRAAPSIGAKGSPVSSHNRAHAR